LRRVERFTVGTDRRETQKARWLQGEGLRSLGASDVVVAAAEAAAD
jgi:hypothetical protein